LAGLATTTSASGGGRLKLRGLLDWGTLAASCRDRASRTAAAASKLGVNSASPIGDRRLTLSLMVTVVAEEEEEGEIDFDRRVSSACCLLSTDVCTLKAVVLPVMDPAGATATAVVDNGTAAVVAVLLLLLPTSLTRRGSRDSATRA
jgi:hypothetical protein